MTAPIFTNNHGTTAKIETELGMATVCDVRSIRDEWDDHSSRNARIAEVRIDGGFTINRVKYSDMRLSVRRGWNGGISVSGSAGYMEKALSDSAVKKLESILAPVVEPLMPRLDESVIWAGIEGRIRSKAKSALRAVAAEVRSELQGYGLAFYNAPRSEAETIKAYELAVKVINEEIAAMPALRSLDGFRDE